MRNPNKSLMGKVAGVLAGTAALFAGCAPQTNSDPEVYLADRDGNNIPAVEDPILQEQSGAKTVFVAPLDKAPYTLRFEDDGNFVAHAEPSQSNPPVSMETTVSRLGSGEGMLEWLVQPEQKGPIADGKVPVAYAWAYDGDKGRNSLLDHLSLGFGVTNCVGVFYNFGDQLPPSYTTTAAVFANVQNHEIPPEWEEGDGKCDSALGEPYSSEDCSPTTDDLVKGGHIKAYFVDQGTGERIDEVMTNPAKFRIWVSSDLEKRLATWPVIVDPMENGQSDCIDIRHNYSQPQKVGPGTYNGSPGVFYDTRVIFDVDEPCNTEEVAGFSVSVTTKGGVGTPSQTTLPVIGSAWVRGIDSYTSD
jgi:hypothetical protein